MQTKITALDYRSAHTNTKPLYLEKQIQKLLCYEMEMKLGNFISCADNGIGESTFNRPTFNKHSVNAESVNTFVELRKGGAEE